MNVIVFGLVITASGLLTACSTMNSDFSCHKTAFDNCLSIEAIDERTRFADNPISHTSTKLNDYLNFHEQTHG